MMDGKLYYTIGEVAAMFQVNPSLIRFWEKEFPFLRPQKNKKGNRLFTDKDIDQFRIIYNLVKERGFTIQGARDYLAHHKADEEKRQSVTKSLEGIRKFLLEIKGQIP